MSEIVAASVDGMRVMEEKDKEMNMPSAKKLKLSVLEVVNKIFRIE